MAMGESSPIQRIGKYELLEKLGEGGFGVVYKARDPALNVLRAIKVLHPILLTDSRFIARFQKEARIAAQLEHPHLVPVYELGEEKGRYYLVMKYLAGGSLKDRLSREGKLSFAQACQILEQVAGALAFAFEEQQLVHRDLKPGNILFDGEGKALVADFGFARSLAETSASFSSGGFVGTPAYMAPEVWRGKPASPATDVYSLACVFYEMVSGQVLFAGESPAEVVTKHVLEGPQFAVGWAEGLPEGVEAVLLKALAKEPSERYATAKEFVQALQGLQKGEQLGTTGAETSSEKPSPAEHFTIEAQPPIEQHLLSEGSQPAVKPFEQPPISLIQPRLARFAILFVVLLIAIGLPLAFIWRRSTMPAPPSFSAQTATSPALAAGWLEEAQDGLFYTKDNQGEEIQLKSGEFLPAADRLKLRTAASSARLRLKNGTVLQLQPNTALTLQPGANPQELDEVELLEGKMIIRSQSFLVKVSHLSVVVRLEQGILGVDFVPELGSLRIACLGGNEQSCTLQSPTGTLNLPVVQEFGYTKGLPWRTFRAAEFVYWRAFAPDLIVFPSPSPTTLLATETALPQATHTSTPTLTPLPTHTPTKTPLQPSSGDRDVPESGGSGGDSGGGGGGGDSGGGVPYP
jgi:serine/threonine protein kinase